VRFFIFYRLSAGVVAVGVSVETGVTVAIGVSVAVGVPVTVGTSVGDATGFVKTI